MVTCLDETRHGLEDGNYVTFAEVKGMEGLNGCKPRKVTVKGPYTFTIGDTTDLGDYVSGGIFTQVKMPKILEFVSKRLWWAPLIWTLKPVCSEISPGVLKSTRVFHQRFRQVRSPGFPTRCISSAL